MINYLISSLAESPYTDNKDLQHALQTCLIMTTSSNTSKYMLITTLES